MGFHDIRFPTDLGFGALGGPERRTEIVTLANGHEERNSPWAEARRRYDAGMGLRSLDDLERLIAFFEARRGRLHAFRWKDWSDWRSAPASQEIRAIDQPLGVGDGVATAFQLQKTYRSGAFATARRITRPVIGTVKVAVGGIERPEGEHWSLDAEMGVVHFVAPPGSGAEVSAGYEFDVPVRFDTDLVQVALSGFQAGELPAVPVVEVRE